MLNNKPFNQSELIRLALAGLDTQIAELQEKRAQLAALTNGESIAPPAAAVPPQKTGKMSDEAKAKISAAAKKRWARVKREQAKAAKTAPSAKKASAPVKAKKSPAKKSQSKKPTPAVKAESVKAAS